ncbi:MAG TPA: TetR/AcrR family transcriptional regulator [Acidimicrobiales bacterium]|nr:TetR/AcrR family transcriptional regulator [Acidimicrobiales bacterium]
MAGGNGAVRPHLHPQDLNPRERMVRTAAQLIRTKGVSGTGLREVVEVAGAPRGSLQHYFPDGKDQLVSEALLWMGSVAARRVERVLCRPAAPSPSALFAGTVDLWRKEFVNLGFHGGCPLVAAAADVAATSDRLRAVISRAFDGWVGPMTAALVETGVPDERAGTLATLMISALEGAIILSRVRQDTTPLDAVETELAPLLDAAVTPVS